MLLYPCPLGAVGSHPMNKACIVCGTPSPNSRCPQHQKRKAPPAARGYDAPYRRARAALRRQVEAAGGFYCHWCGHFYPPNKMTADHDPPQAVAGPHTNLVPACGRCNYGRTANLRATSARTNL